MAGFAAVHGRHFRVQNHRKQEARSLTAARLFGNVLGLRFGLDPGNPRPHHPPTKNADLAQRTALEGTYPGIAGFLQRPKAAPPQPTSYQAMLRRLVSAFAGGYALRPGARCHPGTGQRRELLEEPRTSYCHFGRRARYCRAGRGWPPAAVFGRELRVAPYEPT